MQPAYLMQQSQTPERRLQFRSHTCTRASVAACRPAISHLQLHMALKHASTVKNQASRHVKEAATCTAWLVACRWLQQVVGQCARQDSWKIWMGLKGPAGSPVHARTVHACCCMYSIGQNGMLACMDAAAQNRCTSHETAGGVGQRDTPTLNALSSSFSPSEIRQLGMGMHTCLHSACSRTQQCPAQPSVAQAKPTCLILPPSS